MDRQITQWADKPGTYVSRVRGIINAMRPYPTRTIWLVVWFLLLAWLGIACGNGTETPTPSPTDMATSVPSVALPTETLPPDTPTPFIPTETPAPLAALVNREAITLAEFQEELARYLAAKEISGTNLATDEGERYVLDDLIDQVLLAQAARQTGFVVDETVLQDRLDRIVSQVGGTQVLEDWLATYGFTEQSFRDAMVRAIAAAWMRDQIIATVPDTMEQVHARQILLYNSEQADQVYALLESGQDFATLAANNNPVTAGDLGWFPRGYLTEPMLEAVAFALETGSYSLVVETRLGYHILQVIEKDPHRPLDPDALWVLQVKAVQDWLQAQRAESDIQILLP